MINIVKCILRRSRECWIEQYAVAEHIFFFLNVRSTANRSRQSLLSSEYAIFSILNPYVPNYD